MKLRCPACGAVASADAWENDAIARELMQDFLSLPAPVSKVLLGYLSLFRPDKRALSWRKALRLTRELSSLVTAGHVQVQGKVARPCPDRIWAAGMEQMIERRASLSLPLRNHNYLRKIVWGMADAEDARNEARVRQSETAPTRHRQPDDGLLPMEREMLKRGMKIPGLREVPNADQG